jgi:putative membrane protein
MTHAHGVPAGFLGQYYDHYGMMGGGWWWMWFVWVGGFVVLVLLIYLLVYASRGGGPGVHPPAAPPETPLDILKKRYARGEITREQYEQMKKDLED